MVQKLQTAKTPWKHHRVFWTVTLFVIIFGISGLAYLGFSKGATFTASFEAEDATPAGSANTVSDTTASNTQAVKFSAATGTTLVDTSFDDLPVGSPISVANFRTAMGDQTFAVGNSNLVNTSIVTASGHGNVLRQILPAGGVGGGSGLVVFPKLSQVVDEASIQYNIRFDSAFEWGWGGKLPGLGGASGSTTPGTAAGCASGVDSAWSGRGMWITPGSYGSVTGTNEWIGYMYNFDKKDACGDNQRTGKGFTLGQWHTVRQYYKLNTPGQADGVHRMWLDGVQVINNTAFLYRNNTDLHINYLFWANFRGGSTSSWATAHDGIIDYDNLLITTP